MEVEAAVAEVQRTLVNSQELERRHIARWIRYPDPNGAFAKKTGWLRKLPLPVFTALLPAIMWLMRCMGYDGILRRGECDGKTIICAHVFYQRHWHRRNPRGSYLHMFSVWVHPLVRNTDLARRMVLDFILHAYFVEPLVKGVRIGAGKYSGLKYLVRQLAKGQIQVPYVVEVDTDTCFVHFTARK